MILPRYYIDVIQILPCYYLDIALTLPRYYLDITLILPRYYLDIILILPWYCLDAEKNCKRRKGQTQKNCIGTAITATVTRDSLDERPRSVEKRKASKSRKNARKNEKHWLRAQGAIDTQGRVSRERMTWHGLTLYNTASHCVKLRSIVSHVIVCTSHCMNVTLK